MSRGSRAVSTAELLIATPVGDARVFVQRARSPVGLLALGHGAGGGPGTRDLQAVGEAAEAVRWSVALVEQPYRVAGRRAPDRPERLDTAFVAAVRAVRHRGLLVVGGRSLGARVACRTAAELGAVGVVALAFPLHPPGRPEKSRAEELQAVGVPTLVVQGERDPFGGPPDITRVYPQATVIPIADADHSFRLPGKRDATTEVAAAVTEWLAQLVGTT